MKTRGILLGFTSLLALAAFLFQTLPAKSYLAQYAQKNSPDHWPTQAAVTWNINSSTNGNVVGGGSLSDIVKTSFAAWSAAPNTAISVSQGANSSKTAKGNDGTNLICFVCTADFTQDSSTLAVTFTTVIQSSPGSGQFVGQILDADILFNPAVTFLTNGAACPSGKDCADLQTIATHEIGHFFGLDHSGVVRAVMYPFAPDSLHTLGADDVAGISQLYPGNPSVPTASISGTVRNATTGNGICGAHVFADFAASNSVYPAPIRQTAIGAVTSSDGTYIINGLPAGSYTITAEPFDLPVSNDDISDFGPTFCGGAVPTNFTTRQH
jgi:hypothetical protein